MRSQFYVGPRKSCPVLDELVTCSFFGAYTRIKGGYSYSAIDIAYRTFGGPTEFLKVDVGRTAILRQSCGSDCRSCSGGIPGKAMGISQYSSDKR
jgi:hypothetical protein